MGTRRRFVLGTVGVAGALAVGWGVLPARQRLTTAEPLPAAPGEQALNGWVKIDKDNRVTVVMSKSEMGQGVHTALAMLLAEELDADWAKVRVVVAPPNDELYKNPAYGYMYTAGSNAVTSYYKPLRQFGAQVRKVLIANAAQHWAVPPSELTTRPSPLRPARMRACESVPSRKILSTVTGTVPPHGYPGATAPGTSSPNIIP